MLRVRPTLLAATAVFAIASVGGIAAAHNILPTDYHWSDEDRARAWVTFVDDTNANWPVSAAANEWDYAGNIAVYYGFRTCGGQGHCVNVDVSRVGPFEGQTCDEFRGITHFDTTPAGHFTADTSIRFNDRCAQDQYTQVNRRGIACHEQGHALGLDHAPGSTGTCLGSFPGVQWRDRLGTPRQHDFIMVDDEVYAHND